MYKKNLSESFNDAMFENGIKSFSSPQPRLPQVPEILRIPDIIMKKRNGHELTKNEIDFFISSICDLNNNQVQESQIGN